MPNIVFTLVFTLIFTLIFTTRVFGEIKKSRSQEKKGGEARRRALRALIIVALTPNIDEKIYSINRAYMDAISSNGEIPFLISYETGFDEILAAADGIVFTGGGDIDSIYFGEPLDQRADLVLPIRDTYEIGLCKRAFLLNKPILAICRGIQVLNVALGGSLFQHIDNHSFPETRGKIIHNVNILKTTRLFDILGVETVGVNSIHHQAINRVADALTVSAVSPDGLVEAVEAPDKKFTLGLQWHPEAIFKTTIHNRIFKEFIGTWKS